MGLLGPWIGLWQAALGGGGVPSWVLQSGAALATMDVDLINDRAWNDGAEVTIASLLSCARASSAYYTTSSGVLQSFGNNTLRRGDRGLLVEEARTNLATQSQDFASAAWAAQNATRTANAITAPDGTLTADRITETAITATHGVYHNSGFAISGVHTASVYVKPAERTWFLIWFEGVATYRAWFNLSGSGSIGTVANGTASIEALADGWYRCTLTATLGVGTHFLELYSATGNNITSYAGDGASGYYLWGAQLEAVGSASSYIPTGASSASRAADVVTFSDLTWFDGSQDSIVAEWTAKNVNNAVVWAFDATDNLSILEQTGMSARIADADATYAVTVANTASAGTTVKAAARVAANDIALCMGGGTVASDTSATAPGGLTASRLGCDLADGNFINGYIRRATAWKNYLMSNGELQVFL